MKISYIKKEQIKKKIPSGTCEPLMVFPERVQLGYSFNSLDVPTSHLTFNYLLICKLSSFLDYSKEFIKNG